MATKKKIESEGTSQIAVEETQEEKVAKIKEKARKLAEKLETKEKIIEAKEEIKQEVSTEEEKPKKKEKKKLSEEELKRVMTDTKETLVPITDYIACSVHLGTKVITPDMRKFVYKRRADGLAVLNTNLIDDKLREACKFFANYAPEDVLIACKREAGWPAIEKFSEVTGIKCFTKKYPAGIITNIRLENFIEPKLVIICDPWVDKNAFYDAKNIGVPVIAICDTNNYAPGVHNIIPSNNKSRKSLGLVLYILAKEYLKSLGKTDEAKALKLEDFAGKIEPVANFDNEERFSRKKKEEVVEVSEVVKEGV